MRGSILLAICYCSCLHLTNLILGYSMQYGFMHPKSVPIYEIEISTNVSKEQTLDIEYKQEDKLDYKITLILVFDESPLVLDCEKMLISILQGGIGFNFTTMRLRYNYLDLPEAKLTILIYGCLDYIT